MASQELLFHTPGKGDTFLTLVYEGPRGVRKVGWEGFFGERPVFFCNSAMSPLCGSLHLSKLSNEDIQLCRKLHTNEDANSNSLVLKYILKLNAFLSQSYDSTGCFPTQDLISVQLSTS